MTRKRRSEPVRATSSRPEGQGTGDDGGSYADILRGRMKSSDNPTGHPVTIRALSKGTKYSYEHIRRVLTGDPVGSRSFNDAVAHFLGLNIDRMWLKARGEKLARRFGAQPRLSASDVDRRLVRFWSLLADEEKERALEFIEKLVKANLVLEQFASDREIPPYIEEAMRNIAEWSRKV